MSKQKMCRICSITWESVENQESDSFWIGCGGKTCKCKSTTACCKHEYDWWVHNRCVIIHYENTDAERKQCQFGQRSISSAKNICQIWKKLDGIRSSNRMLCCHPIQRNSFKKLFKKNFKYLSESFIVIYGINQSINYTWILIIAVTLHNLPFSNKV